MKKKLRKVTEQHIEVFDQCSLQIFHQPHPKKRSIEI